MMMSNSSIASIDQLIKLGEFEKAESECLILLNKNENNASAFCKLGEIYLSQEKEVEAQIFFEKELRIVYNHLQSKGLKKGHIWEIGTCFWAK